ncbi:hypothetical protein MRX96_040962 [Rhipicephalus microplus]
MASASNGPVRSCPGGEETGSKISSLPQPQVTSEQDACTVTWGFTLDQLYKMATAFFKEHEGKAFHISYEDKVNLVAHTLQVTHGKYNPERCKPLGYLDVVGRDRRQAWISLGDTDRETAMKKFIELLNLKCPLFRPFVEAHKADMEEKERKRQRLEEELSKQEQERLRQLEQKRLIQEALNRQTYHQFKAYAEQQFPGNPEQQGTRKPVITNGGDGDTKAEEEDSSADEESTEEGGQVMPSIATASMWTRKDIKEFKEGIRKEGSNGILKVGHGEVVTVRVPTHPNGNCLFWEFATDSYDLGFGIYFEWTAEPGNQMSVHTKIACFFIGNVDVGVSVRLYQWTVSGALVRNCVEERSGEGGDVEKGSQGDPHNLTQQSSMSLVIPVFRRDCHEEVYAGSHLYPGQGVYLLKFDNSYSLWRSKTLYYRVYYTR